MELVARCSVLSTRSSSFSPRSMMTSMFATIISFTWSISACTLKNKHNWDVLIIGHPKYLKTIDTSLIMNTVHAHVVILSGSPAEAESEAFLLNLLISLEAKKNQLSYLLPGNDKYYLAMTGLNSVFMAKAIAECTLCSNCFKNLSSTESKNLNASPRS